MLRPLSLFSRLPVRPGLLASAAAVAGLGFDGLRSIGSSFGDDQNTFHSADVALLDAVADYHAGRADPRFQGLRLKVDATTLLDARYQACQSGDCGIGEGQQILGSATDRF